MDIRITRKTFDALQQPLEKWGVQECEYRYSTHTHISLNNHPKESLQALKKIFDEHPEVRSSKTLSKDISIWLDVSANQSKAAQAEGRTVQQAYKLLVEYIRGTPHKHLYTRTQEGERGVMLCYWVESVDYHPHIKRDGETYPPWVGIKLVYEEFGKICKSSITLSQEDMLGFTSFEILKEAGWSIETPILRGDYESYIEEFMDTKDRIGTQYLATGIADDQGIDGNKTRQDSWWMSSRSSKLNLDKNGEPAKVLIDIFQEEEKDDNRRDTSYSTWFWSTVKNKARSQDDDMDEDGPEFSREEFKSIEIPIHPYIACFDLARHKRLRIHVGNLTRYVYDKSIRDRLVLPVRHAQLIDTLLVDTTSKFTDVIRGKSGGTIILCQGPPGTGKTLTAEIYAESLERGLYTIQCSQLGIKIEELESNLMKVLARGRRWGAVMLLDEADVYVHTRGNDLNQNAIVGVFLRVLEYHSGVLFFTTNRGDLVDDAILSRCTARIPYGVPSKVDQIKIWAGLAVTNKVDVTAEEIEGIVECHNKLSGRDIKNLLKLAMLVARDKKIRINADLIADVKMFKPTTEFGD